MVVIRLSRSGAKKNPYYFITVADSRNARDGLLLKDLVFTILQLKAKKKHYV
ncbi:MAG: hypothetical protein Ct9H90mP6_02060 [Gammaproteobacteria bacterium]|nr:MAG: hypothetical protein Ct9H90mP6_02060 [Gammaproteobacteria bacterium]